MTTSKWYNTFTKEIKEMHKIKNILFLFVNLKIIQGLINKYILSDLCSIPLFTSNKATNAFIFIYPLKNINISINPIKKFNQMKAHFYYICVI